jgi:hypothetical protein
MEKTGPTHTKLIFKNYLIWIGLVFSHICIVYDTKPKNVLFENFLHGIYSAYNLSYLILRNTPELVS